MVDAEWESVVFTSLSLQSGILLDPTADLEKFCSFSAMGGMAETRLEEVARYALWAPKVPSNKSREELLSLY